MKTKPRTPIQPPSSHFTPRPFLNLQQQQPHFPTKSTKKPLFKILCSQQQQTPSSSSKQTLTIISILRAIPDWADEIKESRMKQTRPLYKNEDWIQHRSSLRHIRHLLTSLNSRVILSLVPPVIAFTTVAFVVACYNSAVDFHLLPEIFPILRASSLPYQLTAPALALLLVFRTEASYSRFEEGRKAWTRIISGTNDFAGQVISSVESSSNRSLKMALLQYILAFPVALKCHLINGSDAEGDLQSLLEVEDLTVILDSKHRPRCIIQFISESLQLLNIEDSKRSILESKMSCFHQGIAVCEEIIGIPIPLSYTRLTSRFLVLWHLTLPIILWDDCNWIVVPATFISAASLFCIEEVGVLIEEPFPMLALDEQCKLIHNNVHEALTSERKIHEVIAAKGKSNIRKLSPNGTPTT